MADITQLPNGCARSAFLLTPSNWEEKNAPMDVIWRIEYRFYQPGFPPYRTRIKNFARYKDRGERQLVFKSVIGDEEKNLKEGFNPRENCFVKTISSGEINDNSSLEDAIRWAVNRYTGKKPKTIKDMKSQMDSILKAAPYLPYKFPPLKEIRPFHIEDLLNKTKDINNNQTTDSIGRPRTKKMSNFTWNRLKTNLGTMFSTLEKNRFITGNPVKSISALPNVKSKKREAIVSEDIIRIDKHLKANHPGLWAWFHIFYYSGAREIELANLKVKDVDLKKQTFKIIISKGGEPEVFAHVISDDVLEIWTDHIKRADPEHYVFSQNFFPGNAFKNRKEPPPHVMRDDYITKCWKKWVMIPLGISQTAYVLKHMHTTAVVDALDSHTAAKLNAHKSTVMVNTTYDLSKEEREKQFLKSISVPLIVSKEKSA